MKLIALILGSLSLFIVTLQIGHAASERSGRQPLLGSYTGDLESLKKRRLIRIIVPFSKTIYFVDGGAQFGTAVDFGRDLEKVLNRARKKEIERIRVAFVPTPRDELITALTDGRGDVIMANLTVTPDRQAQVDFASPIYSKAAEVLVTGPSAPAVASIEDLAGKEVPVRHSSSYFEHLTMLNETWRTNGKPEIVIKEIDEDLEDEDLLEMVNAGLLPWTIVDSYKADIWASVFTHIEVRPDVGIASDGSIAWAIRKDSPQLKAALDEFAASHKIGTAFGNMLKNRFFKSDKMVKRAYSPADVEKFRELVAIFRKHGEDYSFDYLMLAAQGYQESQLDQSRRSKRGAVGIMQLLPSTAADKAVGITGIDKSADRNVQAGAKYLRHLMDVYLNEPDLTPREKFLFAFAAYNAGPGNLRKSRRKASELGLDPDVWFGNVENGAAAIVGRETVQYVSNIYKYYVAYTLLTDHQAASDRASEPTTAQEASSTPTGPP